jgi:hypothetical protein
MKPRLQPQLRRSRRSDTHVCLPELTQASRSRGVAIDVGYIMIENPKDQGGLRDSTLGLTTPDGCPGSFGFKAPLGPLLPPVQQAFRNTQFLGQRSTVLATPHPFRASDNGLSAVARP